MAELPPATHGILAAIQDIEAVRNSSGILMDQALGKIPPEHRNLATQAIRQAFDFARSAAEVDFLTAMMAAKSSKEDMAKVLDLYRKSRTAWMEQLSQEDKNKGDEQTNP